MGDTGGGGTITGGANNNINGVGVFDSLNGTVLQFRGLNSGNAFMAITLDAANHVILATIDINALATALPAATTTQAGVLETATNAEALAKAATDKIIVPSNFAAMASSDTFAGLVELSTNAEAITGTSILLALTPANLTAVLATKGTTVVFADAPARAGATPAFKGQYAVEQDNNTAWIGTSLVAGGWSPLLTLENGNVSNGATTTIDLSNASGFSFTSSTFNGSLNVTAGIVFTIQGSTSFNNTVVDFTSSQYSVNGGAGLANVVLITDNGGNFDAMAITDFVSKFSIQAGYTPVTNPATIRTFNTATVTLQQLAQAWATLVEDLKNALLPAT